MILQLKLQKPPWTLSPSWKIDILGGVFYQCHRFPAEIRPEIGRKYFFRKKFMKLIRKHIYTFFISLLVSEIFTFFTLDTWGPGFQITSFIYTFFISPIVFSLSYFLYLGVVMCPLQITAFNCWRGHQNPTD